LTWLRIFISFSVKKVTEISVYGGHFVSIHHRPNYISGQGGQRMEYALNYENVIVHYHLCKRTVQSAETSDRIGKQVGGPVKEKAL
jgi:hypothetical protein